MDNHYSQLFNLPPDLFNMALQHYSPDTPHEMIINKDKYIATDIYSIESRMITYRDALINLVTCGNIDHSFIPPDILTFCNIIQYKPTNNPDMRKTHILSLTSESQNIQTQDNYNPINTDNQIDFFDEIAFEINPEIDSPEIDSSEIDSPDIDSSEIDSPDIDSPEIDLPVNFKLSYIGTKIKLSPEERDEVLKTRKKDIKKYLNTLYSTKICGIDCKTIINTSICEFRKIMKSNMLNKNDMNILMKERRKLKGRIGGFKQRIINNYILNQLDKTV